MNSPAARSVARAAVLIATLTVLSRVAGFGRILVFARTVGTTCLGDTYQAVNTVPNIVFEVVAGGALASLVVPLLALPAGGDDWDRVRAGASALLTWTLLVLVPLAVLVAALAEPLTRLLLGAKTGCGPDAVRVGAAMLRVFSPQVPLYGVGIVLTGVLQAARRFAGPAVAPLLSSLVVIGAYLAYAQQAPRPADLGDVTVAQQLTLSVGTTLGVAALTLSLLWPLSRLGLRLRPRLHFPTGMAARALALGGAGIAGLLAQQAAVAVTLVLGNGAGVPPGRMTVFSFAQTIFLLPWAVLAVPIATSVFPQLAARWDAGDQAGYARAVSGSVRAVLFATALAAAVLVAAAPPIARILVLSAPGRPSVAALSTGIVALAPGLVGYGLTALLTRALYAQAEPRRAAVATVIGWGCVAGADLVLAQLIPAGDRVLALALGNTAGMTVLGAVLLFAVGRRQGRAALSGVPRAALVAAVAALAGGGAGRLVQGLLSAGGVLAAIAQAALAFAAVVAVFAGVLWCSARADLAALVRVRALPGG